MPAPSSVDSRAGQGGSLREIALLFLRLGATSFGGPLAHVAMMEAEFVRRRKWLSAQEFLDLNAVTQLIPGPNSTELAIHIGRLRAGVPGLFVAGAAFIAPAMLISGLFAHLYRAYAALPLAAALLYGLKPVVVAVVVQAIWGLAPRAARTPLLCALGAAAIALNLAGLGEIAVLVGAGLLASSLRPRARRGSDGDAALALAPLLAAPLAPALVSQASSPQLFFVFAKIGSVTFGSGYVLLAFLKAELVQKLGWLSDAQLVDAIAAGQVTPGPVFTTATFIGYLLRGPSGACLATFGIFLPAFALVAFTAPLVSRLRASPSAAAFLDGVNVASLALMALATARVAHAALVDAWTLVIALVSAAALIRYRVNASWLLLGAAALGAVAQMISK